MGKSDSPSGPREVVSQALEVPLLVVKVLLLLWNSSLALLLLLDVLVLPIIKPSLTYSAFHLSPLKFGTVLRIKLVYDDSTRTNNGYIIFAFYDEGKSTSCFVVSP